jgi:hypothetical protein
MLDLLVSSNHNEMDLITTHCAGCKAEFKLEYPLKFKEGIQESTFYPMLGEKI